MPAPSTMADVSTTASSNYPAGTDLPSALDDAIRALGSVVKQDVSKGTDITAASSITIPESGSYFVVTGNTGISTINNASWTGREVTLKFSGTPTLTHSSGLILPGAANITAVAGDVGKFVYESSGVWRCTSWQGAAGVTLGANTFTGTQTIGAGASLVFEGTTDDAYELTLDPGDPSADRTVRLDYLANNKVNDFRLTLTTGLPVTISDVTAASTIYCTPKTGNLIALYDGSNWNLRQSAEFSKALSGLTSGKPYDVFCYDNSGTPTLEFLVWTNDTTRATALTYQDGVLVKSGDATRRYLGTFYTTSTTTTEDSATKRYLWNYYHRVSRTLRRVDGTASWTYTSAAWRQANASASNQVEAVFGVAEDVVRISVIGGASHTTTTGSAVYVGIGVDSTSTNSGLTDAITIHAAGAASGGGAEYIAVAPLGRHYFAWLEYAIGATTTFYGTSTPFLAGIHGEVAA